ncbi:hypothetical protein [Mesorhizobium sp. M7A.F.Ca.US.008.03.1.1]|uniref:hypothetical protein n=1 Tax=Mesorhizobium sp. M7A.F.Ca.US.008.03.1.1 TaxID=2496742 RepID=UPI001FDF1F01|nr:hypothetical protein [Mesorhizobium sp. M7A.F.Ca.US.008.03.1.1]
MLHTVTVDRGCFACMLGGTDRKTLFILAAEWRGFEHMVGDAPYRLSCSASKRRHLASVGRKKPGYSPGTR